VKIVLDTNVLVSSLLNPDGSPAKILNLILSEKIILLYDNRILNEYYDVLKREKFGFTDDLILPLIDYIKNECVYVNAEPVFLKLVDEDDKKFYEVFKSGKADYLVTGNLTHFPKERFIISPIDFLKKVFKN